MTRTKRAVGVYDLHYPKFHKPTWRALLHFLKENPVDIFIFGGDQQDNSEISHHNSSKTILRVHGAYKKNTEGFIHDILDPLEKLLPKHCQKVWIIGNHDGWEEEYYEDKPELAGQLGDREAELVKRGWKIVPEGKSWRYGKLTWIHGNTINRGVNAARSAVDVHCENVVLGHFHAPQSFTKVSSSERKQKWMGWVAPTAGETNPRWMENKPSAWLNGFMLAEYWNAGDFNLHTMVVTNGQFAYGGKVYGR